MTGHRTMLSCSTEGWGCVGPTHSFHLDPQEGNPKDTMACLCPLNSATGPRNADQDAPRLALLIQAPQTPGRRMRTSVGVRGPAASWGETPPT